MDKNDQLKMCAIIRQVLMGLDNPQLDAADINKAVDGVIDAIEEDGGQTPWL